LDFVHFEICGNQPKANHGNWSDFNQGGFDVEYARLVPMKSGVVISLAYLLMGANENKAHLNTCIDLKLNCS
jgi:hypothetical protein